MQKEQQQQQRKWCRSDFTFEETLGHGEYGFVYKATVNDYNKVVAIKVISKRNIKSNTHFTRIKRQIEIHSHLRHRYICRMYGYFVDYHNIYIVLEYCAGSSLFNAMKQQRITLTNENIQRIVWQMCKAIQYLCVRHVMHRDIKLENILLDREGNVKLSDFGCCTHTLGTRKTCLGTMEYLPPEMLLKEDYGPEVDVYQLGIVMYELYYLVSPFYHNQKQQMFSNIKEGELKFPQKPTVPERAKELIRELLKRRQDRIRIGEIFEHGFFQGESSQ